MGQRLVVNVYEKDKKVANAYYHWSGYTISSLRVLKDISKAYIENKDISAVDLLKATGARLSNDDNCNRNDGIIEITESGMENSSSWSEGDIDIYLDEGMYDFFVTSGTDIDYIKEYYEDININEIEHLKYTLCGMKLDDYIAIDDLINTISRLEDTKNGLFKINDEIYQSIY